MAMEMAKVEMVSIATLTKPRNATAAMIGYRRQGNFKVWGNCDFYLRNAL